VLFAQFESFISSVPIERLLIIAIAFVRLSVFAFCVFFSVVE